MATRIRTAIAFLTFVLTGIAKQLLDYPATLVFANYRDLHTGKAKPLIGFYAS